MHVVRLRGDCLNQTPRTELVLGRNQHVHIGEVLQPRRLVDQRSELDVRRRSVPDNHGRLVRERPHSAVRAQRASSRHVESIAQVVFLAGWCSGQHVEHCGRVACSQFNVQRCAIAERHYGNLELGSAE